MHLYVMIVVAGDGSKFYLIFEEYTGPRLSLSLSLSPSRSVFLFPQSMSTVVDQYPYPRNLAETGMKLTFLMLS
jgi:hypothetical protein